MAYKRLGQGKVCLAQDQRRHNAAVAGSIRGVKHNLL